MSSQAPIQYNDALPVLADEQPVFARYQTIDALFDFTSESLAKADEIKLEYDATYGWGLMGGSWPNQTAWACHARPSPRPIAFCAVSDTRAQCRVRAPPRRCRRPDLSPTRARTGC